MTLSDRSSIVGVISGLAVLGSLVYLSLQVAQTHKNQRASMNQGTITRNAEIVMFLSQPHINSLTSRVDSGDSQFSAEELSFLHLRLRVTLLTCQDTYVQHKAGLVDQITLENSNAVLRYVLSQPVYRALWKIGHAGYASEWANIVDSLMEGVRLARPQDSVAHFKTELAEVMA